MGRRASRPGHRPHRPGGLCAPRPRRQADPLGPLGSRVSVAGRGSHRTRTERLASRSVFWRRRPISRTIRSSRLPRSRSWPGDTRTMCCGRRSHFRRNGLPISTTDWHFRLFPAADLRNRPRPEGPLAAQPGAKLGDQADRRASPGSILFTGRRRGRNAKRAVPWPSSAKLRWTCGSTAISTRTARILKNVPKGYRMYAERVRPLSPRETALQKWDGDFLSLDCDCQGNVYRRLRRVGLRHTGWPATSASLPRPKRPMWG